MHNSNIVFCVNSKCLKKNFDLNIKDPVVLRWSFSLFKTTLNAIISHRIHDQQNPLRMHHHKTLQILLKPHECEFLFFSNSKRLFAKALSLQQFIDNMFYTILQQKCSSLKYQLVLYNNLHLCFRESKNQILINKKIFCKKRFIEQKLLKKYHQSYKRIW